MEYPSISEYKEAVQNAESFEDAKLRGLQLVMDGCEPVMLSGNSAIVFKMRNETTGELFALKCFIHEQENRADAYRKIIEELRCVCSPYLINLEYIEKGIWVGDYEIAFPVLLMPWVNNESLEVFDSLKEDNLLIPSLTTNDLDFDIYGMKFRMKFVRGGEFMMGAKNRMVFSIDDYEEVCDNEKPTHKVELDNFYIGETLVTQALWEAVMGYNPSKLIGKNFPVQYVSWYDCQEFIERINVITGRTFSLPTEAQWEFAALGGNESCGSLYSGSNIIDLVAWYSDNSNNQIHPVAQKFKNELELFDMTGNLWEWCKDWYDDNYYSNSPIDNPQGPCLGDDRVLRGGSCFTNNWECRVSFRKFLHPNQCGSFVGLRLALNINPSELELDVKGISFKMRFVKGGSFVMGASEVDEEANDNEKPTHKVELDNFYIGETLVTQALWEAVMGYNPSEVKNDNLPVDGVTWYDCQEFIEKINVITGKTFSLPTEAQWEYAARGGKKSRDYLYSGSNYIDEVAWYYEESPSYKLAIKKANELGLFDMSGILWEWCNDWYDDNYYLSSQNKNPQGPKVGSNRVLRGGCWCSMPYQCRTTYRAFSTPDYGENVTGLRLVLSMPK